jgi:uncharacterized protein YjiS (DUF1127 family)
MQPTAILQLSSIAARRLPSGKPASARAAGTPNWLRRVLVALASIRARSVRVIGLWRQRMRMRAELREVDERTLHDLGVSRAEVQYEVDKWFWRA